jgi:hypothetical protein
VRNVQLTEAGVVLVDEFIAVHLDTERRLLASLTALQRARVAAALEVLAEGPRDPEGPEERQRAGFWAGVRPASGAQLASGAMVRPLGLPFDPIERAAQTWEQRFGPAASMRAATSVFRVQQILLARFDEALKPHRLTFGSCR